MQLETLEVEQNISYEEEPVQILDREVKKLQNKKIPLVKVFLKNHKVDEATWERESSLREQYPYFLVGKKSRRRNSLEGVHSHPKPMDPLI